MKAQEILTAGDVAKACGVAPRTASKWIDAGTLPGWRLPKADGTPGDRRVMLADLLAFLRAHGMGAVAESLLDRRGRAALVAGWPEAAAALRDAYAGAAWAVVEVNNYYDLGRAVAAYGPRLACLLADGQQARVSLTEAGRLVRGVSPKAVLGVVRPGDPACELEAAGWRLLPPEWTAAELAAVAAGRKAVPA